MLVPAREVHDLSHLGFRDLVREYANHGNAFLVHGQHDFEGLRVAHAEEPFQDMHDEFHRRVIVVQDQNLVEGRTLCLGPGVKLDPDIIVTLGPVRHHEEIGAHHRFRFLRVSHLVERLI